MAKYDADKNAADRGKSSVVIGGIEWFPRKRSNNLMKEWTAVVKVAEGEERPEIENAESINEFLDDGLNIFDDCMKQLNVLLRNKEGEAPGIEFLDEELDVEDAFVILERLTPKIGTQDVEAGNSLTEEPLTVT